MFDKTLQEAFDDSQEWNGPIEINHQYRGRLFVYLVTEAGLDCTLMVAESLDNTKCIFAFNGHPETLTVRGLLDLMDSQEEEVPVTIQMPNGEVEETTRNHWYLAEEFAASMTGELT